MQLSSEHTLDADSDMARDAYREREDSMTSIAEQFNRSTLQCCCRLVLSLKVNFPGLLSPFVYNM